MTARPRTCGTAFLCLAVLLLPACGRFGKVPRAVIDRQIVLDDPLRGRNIEHLSTEIAEVGTQGIGMTPPVTDADRANGVEARYVVTWKGTTRTENGAASDYTNSGTFTRMSSGEWVTNMGIFDGDGHPALTQDVSGTYRGRYTHYEEYLDCTMTLGSGPDYAGTYACSGRRWRASDDATLVPTQFTGTIALFAVFQPKRVPIAAGLLDGPFHIVNPNDRHTRALVFASDAYGAWHVAKGVEMHGSALGVGFSAAGLASESDPAVYFEKAPARLSARRPVTPIVAAVSAPATAIDTLPHNEQSASTDTTYQAPGPASVPVAATTATAEELPGRPYPNPPSDDETRAAINSFLGEVMDRRHRRIDILGYRMLCAAPVGPECYVRIDGKRRMFTLARKSDGRVEATDLGSCGD